MAMVKWDEKYFESAGLYIWVYRNGFLESSNEKFRRSNLKKIFSGSRMIINKNNNINERGKK